MSLQKLIHNYVAYNAWANARMSDWLSGIGETALKKAATSSFSSIDETVQHVIRVERFWTAFVCLHDVSTFDWSVRESNALKNLENFSSQSEQMKIAVLRFTEPELLEHLELHTPWAQNKQSRNEYILHAVNHSSYHRGQIVTIARSLGITENIPTTDYNFFNYSQ
jgi:uncharacterized damage-inducible protein DinB